MHIYRILSTRFILVLLLLQSCKGTQPARPNAYNDPEINMQTSILNLPIRIYKEELETNINFQLGDVIFEDDNLNDDGLMIKATRQDRITLEIEENRVKYKVPLHLWVRKDLTIMNVDAEGGLVLDFSTSYEIKPDWTLETHTELSSYEWTKTPVVKLGAANLNVTSIANQFLKQAKDQIATAIDDQVKELIDLKSEIAKAWSALQEPILISDVYQTWLVMKPENIGLTPLRTEGNLIHSTVVIKSKPSLYISGRPEEKTNGTLPDFQYIDSETDDDFLIYVGTEIPFLEAERIARENLRGETFTFGKRKVTVQNLEVYGLGNKLGVKLTLDGSYKGDVYFTGKPEYHDRKNEIRLKDVDFEFSSKKSLMKTASWLFKGPLRKKIQENLNFHLRENLENTQDAIEKELENFELAPGLTMKGNLQDLNVSHIYVGVTAIHVKVGMSGKLSLEIKDFAAGGS